MLLLSFTAFIPRACGDVDVVSKADVLDIVTRSGDVRTRGGDADTAFLFSCWWGPILLFSINMRFLCCVSGSLVTDDAAELPLLECGIVGFDDGSSEGGYEYGTGS